MYIILFITYIYIYILYSILYYSRILFKFIIHPSYERAWKNGMEKSTLFRKSSLNFSFGQGSYLISDFA